MKDDTSKDKRSAILICIIPIALIAVLFLLIFAMDGMHQGRRGNGANSSLSTEQAIEDEILAGFPDDIEYLLYDGKNSIRVFAYDGIDVTVRVGRDFYIPEVIDAICPVVLDAAENYGCGLKKITVQSYEETSDQEMNPGTIVNWDSDDGKTGVFFVAATREHKTDCTADDISEYYDKVYKEGGSVDTEEDVIVVDEKFGDMLEPFQGEWQGSDIWSHLIISGENVYSLYYLEYGEDIYEDMCEEYKFDFDEDQNLVVSRNNIPEFSYSINESGQLVSKEIDSDDTLIYEKISDIRTLPELKERVKPRVGMTELEVYQSTWGSPKKRNKTTTIAGEHEQWVYDEGYIYLENGIVTAIQER